MDNCQLINPYPKDRLPLILIGAGGHAKVVAALARATGIRIVGVCDPVLVNRGVKEWSGLPVLGDDDALKNYGCESFELAMGIGAMPKSCRRAKRYRTLTALGYRFPKLIHPSAVFDHSVVIADGAQIMAGVVLQPDVNVGSNTIINTGAKVDHDVNLEDDVHIAPGAVLCGGVFIGKGTFIGASATVLPQVRVGCGCLIAAGSTLARDIADGELHAPHRLIN